MLHTRLKTTLTATGLFLSLMAPVRGQANIQPAEPPKEIGPSPAPSATPGVTDGPRIANAEALMRTVFPSLTSVKEMTFLPSETGGSSFMGLIQRLLGERVDRVNEGLRTRRYIYQAFEDKKLIGIAHSSRHELGNGMLDVTVYYDPEGSIRAIKPENLPPQINDRLVEGKYLDQFLGRTAQDFEVTLGRKGRIKKRPDFTLRARRPSAADARSYFDGITRAVRFNSAFMEIAYFIIMHPEQGEGAPVPSAFQSQTIFKNPFDAASGKPDAPRSSAPN